MCREDSQIFIYLTADDMVVLLAYFDGSSEANIALVRHQMIAIRAVIPSKTATTGRIVLDSSETSRDCSIGDMKPRSSDSRLEDFHREIDGKISSHLYI